MLDCWSAAVRDASSHAYRSPRLGQSLLHPHAPSLVLQSSQQCSASRLCCCWHGCLESGGFYFFISFIMFLFFSCPLLCPSSGRKSGCPEEPQCDWYVHDVRDPWQSWRVWAAQLDPLFRERWPHISMGWWGKSRQQEFFISFSSFTVGIVSGESLLKAVLCERR